VAPVACAASFELFSSALFEGFEGFAHYWYGYAFGDGRPGKVSAGKALAV
jgi:hypothetical protein